MEIRFTCICRDGVVIKINAVRFTFVVRKKLQKRTLIFSEVWP